MADPLTFALDHRLAASTALVGDLPLCSVLLRDDSRFSWLVLVPRRPDLTEIADLPPAERAVLFDEILAAGEVLRALGCDKLNIGAIGNIVAQLHIHVVARHVGDAAWPATVWESGPAIPRDHGARETLMANLRHRLGIDGNQG